VVELTQSNQEVDASLSLTTNLWKAYSNGVCMISGTYVLVDSSSGRPLRLPQGAKIGSEDQLWLTPEGDGEIAKIDYEGTGFYVGDGYILSNRHILAEPWHNDRWLQIMGKLVNGRPKLMRLQVLFPGQSRVYPLKFRLASAQDDLAVGTLSFKEIPKEIPVLPLDQSADGLMVGHAVTMMGYPSGVDRLMTLLPDPEADGLRVRYGESGSALVGQLARRRLIKPLTSQGHIADLHSNQIIYDAATAEGESGAPVFGPSGRVIGIHYGYFRQKDRISSSAIPIRKGLELLQRAGWRPAESAR
jgi:S1-C subfamily serine protease